MAALDPQTLSQYLDFPIQAPPPGVTPDFINPESDAYQVYITAAVCIPLMVLFAVFRVVSKTCLLSKKIVIIEEIVFVIGLLLCLAFIAMSIACVSGGAFGRHAWNVLLRAFTKSQLVLALLVEVTLPPAICLVKISVLMLYLEVFRIVEWVRIASIIGIVVITGYHMGLTIAFAVMCAPTTGSGQFDFLAALVSETCTRSRFLVVLQGAGNVATDLFLLVLPLPPIWVMRMPLKRKIGVMSMFLVGLSAVASSIVGLVYRVQYFRAGEDNIRLVVPLWTTSMAEETAGVIICCMPATATVFRSLKDPVLTLVGYSKKRKQRWLDPQHDEEYSSL